ncbi:tRNA dihydrouridine synthase DusB [Reinekea forsetii]|nr:tRNA dihydrouridine synthase DusB [Reinekea forsetii]
MFSIGPYRISQPTVLAPMAGVTDQPFRKLCKAQGAGLVVSEMVTSDTRLWTTNKSRWRLNHSGEAEPISIQIAGGEASMLAHAAEQNVKIGAQIIDINMGCPAKKVCNRAAGSALMKDEALVREILNAVVGAVNVPVTLKIRTGWCGQSKNALTIAKMAEDIGIKMLAIHGRTRDQGYKGDAEYQTIADVKSALSIPVLANGDIDSPQKAKQVMDYTQVDGVMIGRAAQGNPWIFDQINRYLASGEIKPDPTPDEVHALLSGHLNALHEFYGEYMGVRIARKHLGWYLKAQQTDRSVLKHLNQLESASEQLLAIDTIFEHLESSKDTAA